MMILKKINSIRTTLAIALGLIIIVSLSTCKKYPDNDLWFKSPESAFTGRKNLSAFTVDGVDSMSMWDVIYSTPPYYNGYCSGDLKAKYLILFPGEHGEGTLGSQIGVGSFHFYNNKKYMYIYFKMSQPTYCAMPSYPKYNLFYTVESNWKILELTKSGVLRIQRTYNNKIYEMQFS